MGIFGQPCPILVISLIRKLCVKYHTGFLHALDIESFSETGHNCLAAETRCVGDSFNENIGTYLVDIHSVVMEIGSPTHGGLSTV
jgi:hypothetical protein